MPPALRPYLILLLLSLTVATAFAETPSVCTGKLIQPKPTSLRLIEVLREDGSKISYARTSRGLKHLEKLYPIEMINPAELMFGKVLDLGCGDGHFVMELRSLGVDAYGLDIFLNEEQIAEPGKIFLQGDAANTGLPAHSFTHVYSTWNLFAYEADNTQLMEKVIRESARLLKPGGKLRIAPIQAKKYIKTLEPIFTTHHLQLTSQVNTAIEFVYQP